MGRLIATCLLVFTLSSCYHATVTTGIEPGSQQYQQAWATSFVYGLVPPDVVDAMAECGSAGVAQVETRHSFLNLLAQMLTFGIFSPMEITVSCGQGGEDLQEVQTAEELEAVLRSGQAFVIRP